MLDVSFTELLVVGVVALVVIGPERLPKVARTLGHLAGRAQRYVNDVKSDIQREVELDELRKLKDQMQDAAQSVQSSLQSTEASIRNPIENIEKDTMDAFRAAGSDGSGDAFAEQNLSADIPAVSASDSASAIAQVEAAEPFHQIAPYVTINASTPSAQTIVKPYSTISAAAAAPAQLEIDAISITQASLPLDSASSATIATAVTPTPGSKT